MIYLKQIENRSSFINVRRFYHVNNLASHNVNDSHRFLNNYFRLEQKKNKLYRSRFFFVELFNEIVQEKK